MCGILGYIKLTPQALPDERNFTEALNLQEHRGPDDFGVFCDQNCMLGHRRLSIIDLDSHASQPMVSECGNYIVIFNGEIYNFAEIKEELITKGYSFRTSSDTEVLLNSFIEYGISAVDKYIGMFAFGIYNKKNNEFHLVRDRLGIKPLYYYKNHQKIIFASEVKSILALMPEKPELNKAAISSYLSFRYPILNDTFFQGINSLPPAHYMKITQDGISQKEYWNLSEKFKEQEIDKGEEYYIKEVKNILKSSVQYRMISDVPLGAFLSGGVDSSVITAIMAQNSKHPVKTFTIGFEEKGFNEFEYANIVAEQYKTEHLEINLSSADYIQTMETLIGYKDAPLSVPNEVPLYLMSKELKKYITVVLSGEGADEIFGGYGRIFRSPHDYERIKNIDNMGLTDKEKKEFSLNFFKKYLKTTFTNELEHFINIYSYTKYEEKKKILSKNIDIQAIEKDLINKFQYYFDELGTNSYYNKLMYAFEKIHIVGLLHRVDTTTMATSVEARVPFVDHRLVEFAFTIPVKYKLKWNAENAKNKSRLLMSDKISEKFDTPKYILKKAFDDMLPDKILYRKKVGFPVPLNEWFGGSFNSYAKEILLNDKARSRGIYNIKEIEERLNSNILYEDHSYAMKIWMLINIELFLKKYF